MTADIASVDTDSGKLQGLGPLLEGSCIELEGLIQYGTILRGGAAWEVDHKVSGDETGAAAGTETGAETGAAAGTETGAAAAAATGTDGVM